MATRRTLASKTMLSRSTVRSYAAGSVGTGGFGTLPGLVLVYYMTDSLGISALFAGVIVTLAKLWDVVIDPVIGELSDASLKRTGSRARFMILGALLLPVFFVLTFTVPGGFHGLAAGAWVFVFFVGAATAFSLFQVPYIALPAELTTSYDERTRLLTWRVVVLTVAILAFGGGGPALRNLAGENERLGYTLMAVVAGLAFGAAFVYAAKAAPRSVVQEQPQTREHSQVLESSTPRNGDAKSFVQTTKAAFAQTVQLLKHNGAFRNLLVTFFAQALATGLMLAAAQYVATWVLHNESAVTYLFVALIAPALFMAPVWGRIAQKIGKERAFFYASILFIIGALSLTALLWNQGAWVYIPVALCGSAYAGMQSLPMAMLPDVISYSLAQRVDPVTEPHATTQTRPASQPHPTQQLSDSSESEIQSNQNGAGLFGGVWTAGETTGLALGSTLLTLLLAASGYLESVAGHTVTQPERAIDAITLSFSLVPAVCIALSLMSLSKYPLRKSHILHDSTPN